LRSPGHAQRVEPTLEYASLHAARRNIPVNLNSHWSSHWRSQATTSSQPTLSVRELAPTKTTPPQPCNLVLAIALFASPSLRALVSPMPLRCISCCFCFCILSAFFLSVALRFAALLDAHLVAKLCFLLLAPFSVTSTTVFCLISCYQPRPAVRYDLVLRNDVEQFGPPPVGLRRRDVFIAE
jgi:hypothetical protein